MATGAVHHYLINVGLRTDANIIVETGLARDAHQFAVILWFRCDSDLSNTWLMT